LNIKEAMQLLLTDRILFKETLVKIEDKTPKLVPYIHNPIQLDMNTTSTGRDIYVKPAQVGFSSDVILDFLIDCLVVPGLTSVIISYDEFISGRLLRKAHSFYKALKDTIPTLDSLVHKSVSEMTFKRLGSSFYIGSSRGFAFGRGEPIHNLLGDEFAFWTAEDSEKFMAAAMQRVPLTKTSKIRIGSTANGEGNDFFEAYFAAKEGKAIGKSIFTAHFYSWWMLPEYSMRPDSYFILPGDESPVLSNLIEEETTLLRVFEQKGFSEEESHNKLRWRRYKIVEMESLRRSGETRLLFQQEYPEDDTSCFLTAGDMVHDANQINDMARLCYPAPIHNLYADIWYPPESREQYLVAVDPGVGITSESVATVWQFSDKEFKHCATLSGLYKGDEMAGKVIPLAIYYNNAIVANEDALEFSGYIKHYPNLYYRTEVIYETTSNLIGWATTPRTKPYMITEVSRHLSKIKTHDIRLVSQCRNIRWVQSKRGDLAANIGADDYYMSMAIGICCREAMPVERGLVGVTGWSDDWGK
jgi:hypothetical protein